MAHSFPSRRNPASAAVEQSSSFNAPLYVAAAAALYQFPEHRSAPCARFSPGSDGSVGPTSGETLGAAPPVTRRSMPPPKRARGTSLSRSASFDSSSSDPASVSVTGGPEGNDPGGQGGLVVAGTMRYAPRAFTSSTSGSGDYEEDDNGSVVLKRRRLSGDERQQRSRERNRMHAKKTRLRKKQQMDAMTNRVNGLEREGAALWQAVEDRRTAYILLGIGGGHNSSTGGDPFADLAAEAGVADDGTPNDNVSRDGRPESSQSLWNRFQNGPDGSPEEDEPGNEDDDDESADLHGDGDGDGKRTRRRGKYAPAERELIRRERNRMHAKKTRDRKRMFMEEAELAIGRLERGALRLRAVMASHGMGDVARAVPKPPPLVTPTDEELTRALLADENAQNGNPHDDGSGASGGSRSAGGSVQDEAESDGSSRSGLIEDEN